MATDKELSDFLRSIEKRAYKRTVYAVRDDDAALDIVQDAMIKLADGYFDRPAAELPLLFQRILANATIDWFRRRRVRSAVVRNFSELEAGSEPDDEQDLLETLVSADASLTVAAAEDAVSRQQTLELIEHAVRALPARQREAFLLRYWEELDIAETAAVMGCSEGSVKTHCSRAVHALARSLRESGLES